MKSINWQWLGLAIAAVILQLLYLPTRLAGFVTDFTGLAERIETHGAAGIPGSFGFPALQPVSSVFYYFFYHSYSLEGWGWHLSMTLLHTINAALLFFLVRRLLGSGTERSAQLPAAAGALLFLFSPYATEVIVWRVGFHYLLVTTLLLGMLWHISRWLETPKATIFWTILGLQIAALLTYELAVIAPILGLILILWQHRRGELKEALYRLTIPQFSLVGLYFVGNRALLGSWIGHYGSEVHLQFPLGDMIANVGRYFVKMAAFSRYWPHPWKESVAVWLRQPFGLILLTLLSLGLLAWMFRSFRHVDRRAQLTWAFGLATFIALVPVLNLYFNYLLHIENDRYGYLPALFFYPAWVALLSRLPRGLYYFLTGVYLFISIGLLQRTNLYWAQSTRVYRTLLDDFPAYDRDSCYLLNLPDNLQGAPMFRDFSGKDRAFADALQYVKRQPYSGVLEEVVQYNMVFPTDGVLVEPDSNDLKVTFRQWGNWWWRRGIGASSYRDSSFIFHNEGHHYRLEWRDRPRAAAILYQDGSNWHSWTQQE
ncbi:hypothetical protein [Flavilitoribacter nigricans]|uniref:Glycosyltransferase RgtA/B/C/D-like domain-containing protein n=1 Tax=Flavilitoribacter nigricans (strain ATCC 23147 / DSM 23189 / NBRC 102662 / NCIMB 1420 / SS-2) TaxID=1122177 RepID=A0A2D0N7R7_FLAN2|nr:hypothetical protein [Flavilitoribacter nigricans]PHN04179.1 hypothetical protein CRP01_23585 [Flavilitoribacter nigricans DSM 23189 = NBRC 102662]